MAHGDYKQLTQPSETYIPKSKILIVYFAVPHASEPIIKTNVDSAKFNNLRGLNEKSIIALLKKAEFDANNSAVVIIHNFKSQDENSDGKEGGALGIKLTGNMNGEHGNGKQNYGGRSGDVDDGPLEETGGKGTEVDHNGSEGGKRGDGGVKDGGGDKGRDGDHGGGKGGKASDDGYKAGKGGHAGKSRVGGTIEEKGYGEDKGREGGDGRSNDGKENIDVSDNEDEETTRVERKHIKIYGIQETPEENLDRLIRGGRSTEAGPEGRRRKRFIIVSTPKGKKKNKTALNAKAGGSLSAKGNGRPQSGPKKDGSGGGGGGGNGGGGGGTGAGPDGGGRGGNGGGNNISFTYNMAIFNYIFDGKKGKRQDR